MFFRSSRPMFCKNVVTKKVVLRKFLEGLRPTTLWKKRLWRRSFPVNFAKFLRTHLFFAEHLRWLFLIFPVKFVEILFCYKPMIVKRNFEHDKNFFILFKISVYVSHMIEYGIIIKLSAFNVTRRIANIFSSIILYLQKINME